MDPRERWQALQAHLATARALAEANDHAAALAEVERALAIDPDFLAAHTLKERLTGPEAAVGAESAAESSSPWARAGEQGFGGDRRDALGLARSAVVRMEHRARARRAERRLAAAREAIAEGRLDVAEAALDEARELEAEADEVLPIQRALAEALVSRRRSNGGRWIAAAATLVVGVLAAGYVGERSRPPAATSPATADAAVEGIAEASPSGDVSTNPVPTTGAEILPANPITENVHIAPPTTGQQPPPESDTAPFPVRPAPDHPIRLPSPVADATTGVSVPVPAAAPPASATSASTTPASTMSASTPPPNPTPPPNTMSASTTPSNVAAEPPAPTPQVTRSMAPAEPVTSLAEPAPAFPADTPVAAVNSTSVPPPAQVVPAPRTADDESGIRDALQRYRSAYDELNAQSARAVYPAVDERALARAFNGLASQRITFDNCEVALYGDAATANCSGTMRYVPKIGSSDPQVEQRTWRFTLRKNAGRWAIETARAER